MVLVADFALALSVEDAALVDFLGAFSAFCSAAWSAVVVCFTALALVAALVFLVLTAAGSVLSSTSVLEAGAAVFFLVEALSAAAAVLALVLGALAAVTGGLLAGCAL